MIRKYEQTEIPHLVEIWYKSSSLAHPFLSKAFMEQTKTQMAEMYLPNSDTWVYEEAGGVIGFVSMMGNEIGGLFILPERHSKGIGQQLVKCMMDTHQELEVEVFENNKIGRRFYDKYGFKSMSEYFHEDTQQVVLRMKCSA